MPVAPKWPLPRPPGCVVAPGCRAEVGRAPVGFPHVCAAPAVLTSRARGPIQPSRQTDEGKGAGARGRCPRLPAPGHRARGRPSPEVWDEPPPPHSTWALGPWAGSGADWTWGPGTCHREQRWHSPGRTACFSTPRALNYSQRGQLQTISLSLMEFTLICI